MRMSIRSLLVGAAVAVLVLAVGMGYRVRPAVGAPRAELLAGVAGPASQYFLEVAGIPGSSAVQGHEKQSDVLSYSWGVSMAMAPGAGGRSAGKATMQPLMVAKRADAASVKLSSASAQGTYLPTVTLHVSTDSGLGYMEVKLKNAMVTSYSLSGDSAGQVMEQVSFVYEEIEWTYKEQKPDGSLAAPMVGKWPK